MRLCKICMTPFGDARRHSGNHIVTGNGRIRTCPRLDTKLSACTHGLGPRKVPRKYARRVCTDRFSVRMAEPRNWRQALHVSTAGIAARRRLRSRSGDEAQRVQWRCASHIAHLLAPTRTALCVCIEYSESRRAGFSDFCKLATDLRLDVVRGRLGCRPRRNWPVAQRIHIVFIGSARRCIRRAL